MSDFEALLGEFSRNKYFSELIEKNDLDKDNRISYDEFLIGA
jgi:hypothetical protein